MCPIGGIFSDKLVCHCLLIETQQRLILIDTGLGKQDIQTPKRLGILRHIINPVFDSKMTAFEQIKNLGYSPSDVTDIIPTHLDLDHAGGIADFENAKVHVFEQELHAAQSQKDFISKIRYRKEHLNKNTHWQPFKLDHPNTWKEFSYVKEIEELTPDILLVHLPGHTNGHFGVAVHQSGQWLLHTGDAYYHHKELKPSFQISKKLKLFERFIHVNYKQAMETRSKLAKLKEDSSVNTFCSHDPIEFKTISETSFSS